MADYLKSPVFSSPAYWVALGVGVVGIGAAAMQERKGSGSAARVRGTGLAGVRNEWIAARESRGLPTWAAPPIAKRRCDLACRDCGAPITVAQVDLPACPECGYAESASDFQRRIDAE